MYTGCSQEVQSPSHCPSVSGHLSILISPCCPSQPLSLTHTQSPSLLSLSPSLNRYVIYWGATIRKIITWWSECQQNYYKHSETSDMAPDSRIYPEWARQLDAHPATAELFIDHSNFCCGLKLFVRSKKLQFPSLTELTRVVKEYSGILLEQYLQRGNGFLPPSAIYYYIYWCLTSPPPSIWDLQENQNPKSHCLEEHSLSAKKTMFAMSWRNNGTCLDRTRLFMSSTWFLLIKVKRAPTRRREWMRL